MSNTPLIVQGLWDESSVKQHKLGELYTDAWGRKFRYVQAGGANLVTGNLLQEAAENANYRSMAVAVAAAIGANEISVTLGGTAVTTEQFEDGDLIVESSTGIGQVFKIVSHSVQTSTSGTCVFTVDHPLKIALTTSSQVSVRKSAYDGVIQTPVTTQTGVVVGVALYAMTASYYGWIQSGGDCAVLFDAGTNTANDLMGIIPSVGTAGSVEGTTDTNQIGQSREVVSTDSTMGFAKLNID